MEKPEQIVSAEITPHAGQAKRAARELQAMGFRVLSVGETISVNGPETLWMSKFGVQFETAKVDASEVAETGAHPLDATVTIPQTLIDAIESVAFIVPPELF